jgi:hypothetical protein
VLRRPALVTLDTLVTGQGAAAEQLATDATQQTVGTRTLSLRPGSHALDWVPDVTLKPRTYLLRLRVEDRTGIQAAQRAVVRLLGVDAGFRTLGAAPGDNVLLAVRTDAQRLAVQLFLRSRDGADQLERRPEWLGGHGSDRGGLVSERRSAGNDQAADRRLAEQRLHGRLEADDGRIGFAPLVVRPATPRHRVAVVMPTSTWQTYNFYDADGDGWGDTWYARWKTLNVDPTARTRTAAFHASSAATTCNSCAGSPPRAARSTYADEDVERFPSAAALRPPTTSSSSRPHRVRHHPAVRPDLRLSRRRRQPDVPLRQQLLPSRRPLGGTLLLVDEWRSLGRPEASLCGGSVPGQRPGPAARPFVVDGLDAAPWAFEGTGLKQGDQFGLYGIEIDARSWSSPRGDPGLARIPTSSASAAPPR